MSTICEALDAASNAGVELDWDDWTFNATFSSDITERADGDLVIGVIKRGLVAAKWLITVEYGYGWAVVTLEHRGGEFRKYDGTGPTELAALTASLRQLSPQVPATDGR